MPQGPLPWLDPVIAHRGASGSAPENTLAAIRRAADLGAHWVEVDVRQTATGELVLLHDATLDRTTNGRGKVAETSYETVAALDAGAWFAPEFAGERVPTLAAFIALCTERGLFANVEIKAEAEREEAVAEAVVTLLQDLWPNAKPPPLISASRPRILRKAALVVPGFPRGLIVRDVPNEAVLAESASGCVSVHPNADLLTKAKTEFLLAGGYAVLAYTVNDPERARVLRGWGVNAIFTDYPEPERWR